MKNSSVDRDRESHDLVVAVAGSFKIEISICKNLSQGNFSQLDNMLEKINCCGLKRIQL
jgi:hypothetical protein